MHALGFPTINLDLMYGLPGQTLESWLGSVRDTLALCPTEIYLYPLYVRPLTVLGRRAGQAEDPAWDALRLEMYRAARDLLRSEGFDQRSMRMFRRRDAGAVPGPVYSCQSDGMVGLGCGARSYTGTVHYASAYATGAKGVRSIIDSYIQRTDAAHATADWGCVLDAADQRRRFAILSILSEEGISLPDYAARFGGDPRGDIPELRGIIAAGFAEERGADSGGAIRLTAAGLERCDQIGPALRSARIIALMQEAPAL
jgi:oxygen-independent coproporphyrinogen-3 oxidase